MKRNIYSGQNRLIKKGDEVEGNFVVIENEKYYKISQYHEMDDFFMSIVSDSDHWMFISSNGSLSAGRKDRNNALFPYYTDDKIHDYHDITGSKTLVLVDKDDKSYLWQPFLKKADGIYKIKRNIYKNLYGNKIIFEEINEELGLTFSYSWNNSEKYGFVRKSNISNQNSTDVKVEILDGIQNLLPYGVDYDFQNTYSNLLDAYKKNELLADNKIGVFALSSIVVDRPEPSESLKTTAVWSYGLPKQTKYLLSNKQVDTFLQGEAIETELDIRAQRGAYYVNCSLNLTAKKTESWYLIADINLDSKDLANLDYFIANTSNIEEQVINDIATGNKNLMGIVANADGMQLTEEPVTYARHFSNTLFNVMRGGIFKENYTVLRSDFILFVEQTNRDVYNEMHIWLEELPEKLNNKDLLLKAKELDHKDLLRICYEYLPLTFSRRHGDPSRPWNLFSIETKNEDGSTRYNFQGNWRDIFQNWEALAYSYPEYLNQMIAKFVNASTADGYNPYRITREGIDWECPDPEDPWAFIGYWGDHQIIYLQKFLELSESFHPGKLDEFLSKDLFVYANVPYRIKPYNEIIKDPKDTIVFDEELNKTIQERAKYLGADGRLVLDNYNKPYHTNFTEKVLVTLLAKLSNFVPEAGIWLNTQRPEWNDANNALVGSGVSMVTLYYIRRFLSFWNTKLDNTNVENVNLSVEVRLLFDDIKHVFEANKHLITKGFSDTNRKDIVDQLGEAGGKYRERIYKGFSEQKESLNMSELQAFVKLSLSYIDQSIDANRREDNLYHAYNLISISEDKISIRYLYEMLEGQVAVLSSGYLSPKQGLEVLDALKNSALFREDQYSYILYPDRQLPRFNEKNNIPAKEVQSSELLSTLITDKDLSIISEDAKGNFHFNGLFRNAEVLKEGLLSLDKKYATLVEEGTDKVLSIYEKMFDHQSFTGRSGTFYGYEGLGSIYWHMVSKLLLAAQEIYFKGVKTDASKEMLDQLKQHYYEIKAGIGFYKSPKLYGAFPTDAYSHTPGGKGVKQPGMTGQVKEDFIARLLELGVEIKAGEIHFNSHMLNTNEWLSKDDNFTYVDINGDIQNIELEANQMAFTYCQIPIIYNKDNANTISISFSNGNTEDIAGTIINKELSMQIFNRSNSIARITLSIK